MYEQSGMYNRDLPEQHDDWQQGQGYQAYQQVGPGHCCAISKLPVTMLPAGSYTSCVEVDTCSC